MKKIVFLGLMTLTGCEGIDDKGLFSDENNYLTYLTTTATVTTSTTSSGQGGSGGSGGSGGCEPKITCQSVGAECGVILNDGCGNIIDCPGECFGYNTCGGGSDGQFKCGCTAKTCVHLECGSIDDGCGGIIDSCGACDPNKYQTACGAEKKGNGTLIPPQNNICGGGCGFVSDVMSSGVCKNSGVHNVEWQCDSNSKPIAPQPPSTDCIQVAKFTWCCTT